MDLPKPIADPIRLEAARRELTDPSPNRYARAGRLGGLRSADRYNWHESSHGWHLKAYRGTWAQKRHNPEHCELIRNGHYRRLAIAKRG